MQLGAYVLQNSFFSFGSSSSYVLEFVFILTTNELYMFLVVLMGNADLGKGVIFKFILNFKHFT